MQITAENLQTIAYGYFMEYRRTPLRRITANDCNAFAWNVYRTALAIPSDPNAKSNLINYVYYVVKLYGGDPQEVLAYFKKHPEFIRAFILYCQQNFTIESNMEIVSRLIGEAFQWVGKTVANAAWNAIKPLIPLVLLAAGGYILFKYADKKTSKQ